MRYLLFSTRMRAIALQFPALPVSTLSAVVTAVSCIFGFYMNAEDLNSCSHASAASTLSADPPFQIPGLYLFFMYGLVIVAQTNLKLVFSGLRHHPQLGCLCFSVETASHTVGQAGLELHSPICL